MTDLANRSQARCRRSWAGTSLRSASSLAHELLAGFSSDTAAVIGTGAAVLLLLLLVALLQLFAALGLLPDARGLSSLYAGGTT